MIDEAEISSKISRVVALCEVRINSDFGYVLTSNECRSMASSFDQIHNLISSNQPSNQIKDRIDSLLNLILAIIVKIPTLGKNETKNNINSALKLLNDSHNEFISRSDIVFNDFTAQINDQLNILKQETKSLTDKQSNLETKQSAFETQLTATLASKISEFESRYATLRDKLEQNYNALHKDHDETLKALSTAHDNNLKTLHVTYNSSLNEMYKTHEELCKNNASFMNGKLDKIKGLYSLAGTVTTVGSQKRYADKSNFIANVTFSIAIVIMVLTAIIIGLPLLEYVKSLNAITDGSVYLFDWKVVLYRTPAAMLFLIPAFYLANLSNKLRDKSMHYRDLEVKLAAIHPYLEHVESKEPISARDHLRLDLARHLFSPDK